MTISLLSNSCVPANHDIADGRVNTDSRTSAIDLVRDTTEGKSKRTAVHPVPAGDTFAMLRRVMVTGREVIRRACREEANRPINRSSSLKQRRVTRSFSLTERKRGKHWRRSKA